MDQASGPVEFARGFARFDGTGSSVGLLRASACACGGLVIAMALVLAGVASAAGASLTGGASPTLPLRERLVRDMKARTAYYLSVLGIVRRWCHRHDEVSVVRVMGAVSFATKDRERWLRSPWNRVASAGGASPTGGASDADDLDALSMQAQASDNEEEFGYFCEACHQWLNGHRQWCDHIEGKKHHFKARAWLLRRTEGDPASSSGAQ